MHCGFSRRPPPRWPAIAGQFVVLVFLFVLTLGLTAEPASARPCGPVGPGAISSTPHMARTLASHVTVAAKKECEPEQAWPDRRGNADPMSFVFFMGIIVAFVVVPVALGRREKLPPE